jgi:hypothetical protein
MSRFRDLAETSFGFLTKLAAALEAGGGVTAGSAVSNPSDFFVNEVVDILEKLWIEG